MDVAVVGAGPAGAWAAYRLARGGARVTVFDPSHPREKPCGGGLTSRALAVIAPVLPDLRVRAVAVRAVRFESAGDAGRTTQAATVELAAHGLMPESALVIASRAELDRALLDAAIRAGARHVALRVTDVSAGPRGAEVRTERGIHAARVVVGADGAAGITRRRLARPFGRARITIGTGFFAHGITSDRVEIACVADPPGYIWSFPRSDHLAIGIGAEARAGSSASDLRERLRAWMGRAGLGAGARLEPYSFPIPGLSAADLDAERPAGPGWLLAGDAAGLVDPITREGIHFALLSGAFAAEAILDGGRPPERAYEARLRDEIYPELRRADGWKETFFRPEFGELMARGLARSAGIRGVFGDLVSGRQAYRGLRRRLVGTLEVRLALAWARL